MAEHHEGQQTSRAMLESLMVADLQALTAEGDRIGRVFAGTQGVTTNDFYGLLHIMVAETAGRPLTAGELRQRMDVSGAAITYLVERLIGTGHIRRESHPSDRRKVILRYEPKGIELINAFLAPLGNHIRSALAEFAEDDLASAHRVFCGLTDAMRMFRDHLAAS
ncbi:MarR family winged helix-turn-helix transcriptional regulator [Mycobacterium deserti]|uniref:MarR family transcriptional regulator n=1 Tax=Mycobacterium deserti TaxID=2978347 RepID=A0ABT2M5W3_9MYCO|nr:MarR family transcriptional regulator [Mycobacterium deserti]MCT7657644.1 MarR family transcriptional regulator [Mycobacterium deserti]